MSLPDRQKTCATCGRPFIPGESVNVEPLVDDTIRYVATHANESTHPTHRFFVTPHPIAGDPYRVIDTQDGSIVGRYWTEAAALEFARLLTLDVQKGRRS